jgi:hypothetical protein
MRQHAETLTAHGYQVKVREYHDGEILEVTPPPPRLRRAWWRSLGLNARAADGTGPVGTSSRRNGDR